MSIKHIVGTYELEFNPAQPTIMHIDLNSCFATIEQQAKRHWRGQPVGVVAYDSPGGIILAASYEAKALGIRLGTRVWEAQKIAPNIKICRVDPPKYRQAHRLFREVLEHYTSDISARSIDEFAVDLRTSRKISDGWSMEEIGHDIKRRIRNVVGEAVSCNIGIAPNRLLAKLAAGLHKPDGLDQIDSTTFRSLYPTLELKDLPGIDRRYSVRLNLAGIENVVDFYQADVQTLRGVFGGIVGYYWWLRLRGWEIDDKQWKTGSQIGHQYALKEKLSPDQLDAILYKLSQKIARRLGTRELSASGIRIGLRFVRSPSWHISRHIPHQLMTAQDIFYAAKSTIRSDAPEHAGLVSLVSVTTFDFQPVSPEQLGFAFDGKPVQDRQAIAHAMNSVNDRFGDFTLVPATMLGTDDIAGDSIAFGNLSP